MPDLFSPDALSKAVHANLEDAYVAIPPGKSHALLVDATTGTGVSALYVQRVGDGWHVALHGEYSGHDRPAAGVSILKAW
jgi:hypothetical protein